MGCWSKLQREIYKLLLPELKLQIQCVAYRVGKHGDWSDYPRYWISLGKEIIWDYPINFDRTFCMGDRYLYLPNISAISDLLREYIETPKDLLCEKDFPIDRWGLADILKAADRRLGKGKLRALLNSKGNSAALKVLDKRETLRPKEKADGLRIC